MTGLYTVIVTFNATPWIERCLSSLESSRIKTKVIIVDNASTDDTISKIEKISGEYILLLNEQNKGFGQANNQGMMLALEKGARHVFLMNQDVYVFPDTLELLVAALETYPKWGILSALQLRTDGHTPDSKMKAYLSKHYADEQIKKMVSGESKLLTEPQPLRFVNAAAWMLTRECILSTGLFHPAFYHYGEDNHYCSRVQYHGFKTGFLPAAKVIHDRAQEQEDAVAALRKKIKTVPLYTLLDIRKPYFLAVLLGRRKLRSTWKKLQKAKDPKAEELYHQQKEWFTSKIDDSLTIRKATKTKWKTADTFTATT